MLMAGVGRVDAAAAATSSHLLWRAASRPKLPEASSRSIIAKFFFSEDATVTSPHCTCLTHSQQLPAVLTRVQALCTKSYRTRHFKKNKRQRLFSLQLRHVRHALSTLNMTMTMIFCRRHRRCSLRTHTYQIIIQPSSSKQGHERITITLKKIGAAIERDQDAPF